MVVVPDRFPPYGGDHHSKHPQAGSKEADRCSKVQSSGVGDRAPLGREEDFIRHSGGGCSAIGDIFWNLPAVGFGCDGGDDLRNGMAAFKKSAVSAKVMATNADTVATGKNT